MSTTNGSNTRRIGAAFVFTLALALSACSGEQDTSAEESTDPTHAEELQSITVGVMPLVDLAPLHLGVETGIFESHGLDVELVAAQGGAAIIPAVTSGQYEFGFSNPTSLIVANSRGVDVKIIAPGGTSSGDEETDYGATVVPADSGISSASDLEGRSVAVNTLNNISDSTVKEAVRNDGGDPAALDLIELPFPDMIPAIEQGNVDAAFLVEPFLTMGLEEGLEPIAWNWIEVSPDLTASAYFTSGDLAEQQPELVEQFQAAIAESATYAEEHPDETREILTSYTQISEDLAQTIRLPRWVESVNEDSLERLIEISDEDGLLADPVALDDLILQQ
ncbi:MAG: ABC transporter substrate-binding protein [Micrococcaceae bacterium]